MGGSHFTVNAAVVRSGAANVTNALLWANAVPTVEGWYWKRNNLSGFPVIVQVLKRPGHSYLAIESITGSGKRDFEAVVKMNCEWAGPIVDELYGSAIELNECIANSVNKWQAATLSIANPK